MNVSAVDQGSFSMGDATQKRQRIKADRVQCHFFSVSVSWAEQATAKAGLHYGPQQPQAFPQLYNQSHHANKQASSWRKIVYNPWSPFWKDAYGHVSLQSLLHHPAFTGSLWNSTRALLAAPTKPRATERGRTPPLKWLSAMKFPREIWFCPARVPQLLPQHAVISVLMLEPR